MKELLRLLSVRILNANNDPIGSGFLYIHDQEKVFVLTAAHVLNDLTDDNTFWAECQPERSCEGTDIRCFRLKRSNVYSDYQSGNAPKDKWISNDVAVIRLQDIEDQEWLKRRMCEVRFAQKDAKLEECRFMGFGYPGYTEEDDVDLAEEEFKPECASCKKYVPHKDKIKWELGLKVANARNKKEYEGFSGSILAIAGLDEIVLAGIVQCVYKEFAGNEILGADLAHIQRLLEDKENGAGITVHKVENLKRTSTEHTPVQSDVSVISDMSSVSDFNLRCIRNMLEGAPEGQSWAHLLRDGMNRPDVEFGYENELGNRILLETFADDDAFLKNIFPKEIMNVLDRIGGNKISNDQIMNGTYSDEVRNRALRQLVIADGKAIDGIISNCSRLMKCPGWERSFCVARKAFFALMGNKARQFQHDVQACMFNSKRNDKTARVLAMFIVYSLLGAERFGYLPIMLNNKPIEVIFG